MTISFSPSFSDQARIRIAEILKQYPNTQAACMPVLHLAQEEFGHLSNETLELVANTLNLPLSHVLGVATFYTMYHRNKVGEHILMMCTNVSCMLKGGEEVLKAFEKRLGIQAGQTTSDQKFTLIEEECLAACAGAPALVCGERYFLEVTPEQVDRILTECQMPTKTDTSLDESNKIHLPLHSSTQNQERK